MWERFVLEYLLALVYNICNSTSGGRYMKRFIVKEKSDAESDLSGGYFQYQLDKLTGRFVHSAAEPLAYDRK